MEDGCRAQRIPEANFSLVCPTSPADSEQRLGWGFTPLPWLLLLWECHRQGVPPNYKADTARVTLQLTQGQALGATENAEVEAIGCMSPWLDSG